MKKEIAIIYRENLEAFKKLVTLIYKELHIIPILIGNLSLTEYFYYPIIGEEVQDFKIEFLLDEIYCSGEKRKVLLSLLEQNGYVIINNNQLKKDNKVFLFDTLEKYQIDKKHLTRHIFPIVFKREKKQIIWKEKISIEYNYLDFNDFKNVYKFRKDKNMLELIKVLENTQDKEKLKRLKNYENHEITVKIQNFLVFNKQNKQEFINDLVENYKKTVSEIEELFIEQEKFLEEEQKRQEQQNTDVLEIVHGYAQAGALKRSSFKNNKIIALGYNFAIGKLDHTRNDWLKEFTDEEYMLHVNMAKKELKESIKQAKKVRIWSSKDEDNEYLMLLYLCDYLPDDLEISVTFASDANIRSISYAGGEKEIKDVFKTEHILTKEEKEEYKKKWQKIVAQNGEVRFIEEGVMNSVNFDYFDEPLLDVLKTIGEVSIIEFVGDLIGNYFLNNAGDMEYKYLIDRLIKKNKIEETGMDENLRQKHFYISDFDRIIKVKE